jgi:hypothetical protein
MEGLNVRFDIIRLSYFDDDVGGAVESGTTVASAIPGRINLIQPTQQSLEVGLEVPIMADVFIRPKPGTLTIFENDQVLLVSPADHPNFNQRFRVEGEVQSSSMHPKNRNQFLRLRATRVEQTRTEELM